MPFTLSHAAAVLPALRRTGRARGPLVGSALVAGSFAPDLTYFAASAVPGAMAFGTFTHSPAGVVTVDAVFTAVLAGVWLLLREPLTALLPARLRGRVYAVARGEHWRGRAWLALAAWFYVCAVAGSVTHVVWDSFTHHDRWGTEALPFLNRVVWGQPVFSVVQYAGSAVALGVLGWFLWTAVRLQPATATVPAAVPRLGRRERTAAVALLAAATVAGAVQRVLLWYSYDPQVTSPLDVIPALCFGAGTGLACGLLLYGAAVRLWHRSRARTRTPALPG